jgi:hypothetical protein
MLINRAAHPGARRASRDTRRPSPCRPGYRIWRNRKALLAGLAIRAVTARDPSPLWGGSAEPGRCAASSRSGSPGWGLPQAMPSLFTPTRPALRAGHPPHKGSDKRCGNRPFSYAIALGSPPSQAGRLAAPIIAGSVNEFTRAVTKACHQDGCLQFRAAARSEALGGDGRSHCEVTRISNNLF